MGHWEPALKEVLFDAREFDDATNARLAKAIDELAAYCWNFQEHMESEFSPWNPFPDWTRKGWTPRNPVVALGPIEGLSGWAGRIRQELAALSKLVHKGWAMPWQIEHLRHASETCEVQKRTVMAGRGILESVSHPEYEQRALNAHYEAREFASAMETNLSDLAYEINRRMEAGRLTLPAYGLDQLKRSTIGKLLALVSAVFGSIAAVIAIYLGVVEMTVLLGWTERPVDAIVEPAALQDIANTNRDLESTIVELQGVLERMEASSNEASSAPAP